MILILNLIKRQLIRLYNFIKKKTCLRPKVEHASTWSHQIKSFLLKLVGRLKQVLMVPAIKFILYSSYTTLN